MRGTTVFPLEFANAALIANVPPHLAPPNSFIPGSYNVIRDIDGLIKPRYGYTPFNGLAAVGQRLHGGVFFENSDSSYQYVIASDTDWWALVGGAWTDITDPANKNIGADSDPARFAVFFQSGKAYAIGVDNFSPPRRWTPGESIYETLNANPLTITNIVETAGTTATVTIASAVSRLAAGDSITIAGNSVTGFNGAWEIVQVLSSTSFTYVTTGSALGTGTGGTVTDNTIMSAPAARDIAIIANRVVLLNTLE
ncbi:MAG: hypothetical protein ACREQE_07640, partial [Candidatus Binataceae bacterium]